MKQESCCALLNLDRYWHIVHFVSTDSFALDSHFFCSHHWTIFTVSDWYGKLIMFLCHSCSSYCLQKVSCGFSSFLFQPPGILAFELVGSAVSVWIRSNVLRLKLPHLVMLQFITITWKELDGRFPKIINQLYGSYCNL